MANIRTREQLREYIKTIIPCIDQFPEWYKESRSDFASPHSGKSMKELMREGNWSIIENVVDDLLALGQDNVTNVVDCIPAGTTTTAVEYTGIEKVIFDVSWNDRASEVVSLGLLHKLQDLGECDILAVITSGSQQLKTGGIEAVNRFFGRNDIPIGVTSHGVTSLDEISDTGIRTSWFENSMYQEQDYSNSTSLYRETLANAVDGTVTIIVDGHLANIKDLLESSGDGFSPLNGADLLAQKCDQLVIVGGYFNNTASAENNFSLDPDSVLYVLNNLPNIDIAFIGKELGDAETIGSTLDSSVDIYSPVRFVVDKETAGSFSIPSHGPLAVLYAIRDVSPGFAKVQGTNVIDSVTGINTFTQGSGPHYYITADVGSDLNGEIEPLTDHDSPSREVFEAYSENGSKRRRANWAYISFDSDTLNATYNSTNERVEIGSSGSFKAEPSFSLAKQFLKHYNNEDWTINLCFEIPDISASSSKDQIFLSIGTYASNFTTGEIHQVIMDVSDGNKIKYQILNTASGSNTLQSIDGPAVTDGVHNIVITNDKINGIRRFYFNGSQVGSDISHTNNTNIISGKAASFGAYYTLNYAQLSRGNLDNINLRYFDMYRAFASPSDVANLNRCKNYAGDCSDCFNVTLTINTPVSCPFIANKPGYFENRGYSVCGGVDTSQPQAGVCELTACVQPKHGLDGGGSGSGSALQGMYMP